MANMFRLLRADEIDARIGQLKNNGASLLLYKNARCDQNILDETVGPYNWQRKHDRDNANCTVSIWDKDKGQWISKEDVGTESKTEAEKGLASDSFKRACVNWGIGRELYTAPFIWVNGQPADLKDEKFNVTEIDYNENREINRLVITNKAGDVIFSMGSTAKVNYKPKEKAPKPPKPEPIEDAAFPVCERCGKPIREATGGDGKIYSPADVAQMTKAKYGECLCKVCSDMAKAAAKEKTA